MTFLVALIFVTAGIIIVLSAKNNQTIVEYVRGLRA